MAAAKAAAVTEAVAGVVAILVVRVVVLGDLV